MVVVRVRFLHHGRMQKMKYLCEGIAHRWFMQNDAVFRDEHRLAAFLELEISRIVAETVKEVRETAHQNITRLLGL
jgi:hypothetical protein